MDNGFFVMSGAPGGIPGGIINGTGRHVDNSDPNAPKEIASRKIVDFEAHFCTRNSIGSAWQPGSPAFNFLHMSVRKDESGRLVLAAEGHKVETDEAFLEEIQGIIENNSLVGLNGTNEYTEGLPTEFQPYTLKALYDSGEKLFFSVVGNPGYEWCRNLKNALCYELARHGIEDLLPPKADRTLVRFDLKYDEWPRNIRYNSIYMEGDAYGKPCLHYIKSIWNRETRAGEFKRIINVTPEFYAHISELVEKTRLRDYSNGRIDYPDGVTFDTNRKPAIGYCAQGESDVQFNTFVVGEDISDGLREAAAVIREYIESVFENYTGEDIKL